MKYDYGRPEQGYSFEHYNFYDSLVNMGHEIIYFDFMTLMQKYGQEVMNQKLLEVVKNEKPDLMFTVLFTNELDPKIVKDVSENLDTITVNWFCDDHWRFDNFSKNWAPCFNYVVTTAKSALPKYDKIGYSNVIKSQWACNHFLYRKLDLPQIYDLTFIGQPHGNRREVIKSIQDTGIDVKVWGKGWENGRISQEDMIRIFNQSRINLNLCNASMPVNEPKIVENSILAASRLTNAIPFGQYITVIGRQVISAARSLRTSRLPADANNIQYYEQIKGRNFEVPGCGGFLLTGIAEDLESYYEPDKEVVCFDGKDEMINKINYYLDHENERVAIANAGYKRTLYEHTYVHRFTEIFKKIGLQSYPIEDIMEGKVRPGKTMEIQ